MPSLSTRTDAAEAALQQAALGRPDALALLETAVARLAETVEATAGAAFVASGDGNAYIRCAVAGDVPDVLDLDVGAWPDLRAGTPVAATAGTRHDEALLGGLGTAHAILVPIRGAAPGVVLLGRAYPFDAAERGALSRLAALFSTLWAWTDAEARFQRTVADLDDALFTFGHDAAGRRVYAVVTPQAEAITGLDPDAILAGDADWTDLIHADDRAAFAAHDACLRAGEPSRIDVRLVCTDGLPVWISERATPGVDAAGRPTASGLLSDVTDQKLAEATLDRARRTAERAADARMAFLRLMSHELRTPLGAIRGFAELLAEEVAELPDAPPVVAEFTQTIGEASARALRLVSDLLDLARLETGALDMVRAPVALAPLVRASAARLAPELAARYIALDVHTDVPSVALGDAVRIEQIVAQLLANASAFTEAGSITVRVGSDAETAIVSVADTGSGMDEVFLESLFEPFAQEDVRVNRDREGSGLGLAIARRLAETMDGRLTAETEKGRGSTFRLVLPLGPSGTGDRANPNRRSAAESVLPVCR